MPMIYGRLGGALIGVVGGPFGIAFGFLIGLLVDQYAGDLQQRRSLERFLRDPATAPPRTIDGPSLSLIGVAVWLSARDGIVHTAHIEALRELLVRHHHPRSRRDMVRAIDTAVRLLGRFDAERLAHALAAQLNDGPARGATGEVAKRSRNRLRIATDYSRSEVKLFLGAIAVGSAGVGTLPHWLVPLLGDAAVSGQFAVYDVLDPSACAILGVPPTATIGEVKSVYRRLAAQFHPDSASALDETQRNAATAAFIRITSAYETLLGQLQSNRND